MYGSLSKNKVADILILDGNPLEDIHATRKINAVIAKGKLYDRNKLNAMLDELETKASK